MSVHAQHRPRRRFLIGRKRCRIDGQSWPCSTKSTVTPTPAPAQRITTVTLRHLRDDEYVLASPVLQHPRPLYAGATNPVVAAELVLRQQLGQIRIGPWRILEPGNWRAEIFS